MPATVHWQFWKATGGGTLSYEGRTTQPAVQPCPMRMLSPMLPSLVVPLTCMTTGHTSALYSAVCAAAARRPVRDVSGSVRRNLIVGAVVDPGRVGDVHASVARRGDSTCAALEHRAFVVPGLRGSGQTEAQHEQGYPRAWNSRQKYTKMGGVNRVPALFDMGHSPSRADKLTMWEHG